MIRSWRIPVASASSAERIADSSIASIITSRASRGAADTALASISSVRIAWSSEPQLTPMRTGTSFSIATRMIVAKCSSWRLAPTFPGLIRYLASDEAISGYSAKQLVAVVVEVTDDRDVDAEAPNLADHLGHGGGSRLRVDRHPDELRPGVRQARDLDRRAVGVGRVGVGHRLDDDRVRRADEHAADVDADRRPASRPEGVRGAHRGPTTRRPARG